MKATVIAAIILLSGCATTSMSSEQLKAAAQDKNASAYCVQATGPWGQAFTLYTNVDKGTVGSGEATIKCGSAEATFTNRGKQ